MSVFWFRPNGETQVAQTIYPSCEKQRWGVQRLFL